MYSWVLTFQERTLACASRVPGACGKLQTQVPRAAVLLKRMRTRESSAFVFLSSFFHGLLITTLWKGRRSLTLQGAILCGDRNTSP